MCPSKQELEQDKEPSFLDHLEVFRWVIIRSLVAMVLLLPLTYWGAQPAINRLIHDCAPPGFTLQYFTLMEPFFTQLKVAFILTLFFAFPYIAWQFWRFTMPALHDHERRHFGWLAFASWLLFVGGATFGYFTVLPLLVSFSTSFENPSLHQMLGLSDFVTIAVVLLLAFGLIFQLPIVVITLVRLGLVKKATLKRKRPMIIVAIAITAGVICPSPDVVSQLAMAAPTYLLFECSLLICREPVKKDDEQTVNLCEDVEGSV